jgi:hypothetical protein
MNPYSEYRFGEKLTCWRGKSMKMWGNAILVTGGGSGVVRLGRGMTEAFHSFEMINY